MAENAYSAAFRDMRFGPLAADELPALTLSVALLTTPEPMAFTDEEDLVNRLQPGTDGLILEDQGRRGLFLPAVWESLPTPAEFFTNLKRKAGLPPDHWSDTIRVKRFTTVGIASDGLDDPQSIFRA